MDAQQHGVARTVPHLDGVPARPLRDGEPVFDAPWQRKAFDMVVAMHRAGLFEWDEFAVHLVRRIRRRDSSLDGSTAGSDEVTRYYESWAEAMYDLVRAKKMVSEDATAVRQRELLSGHRQDVH